MAGHQRHPYILSLFPRFYRPGKGFKQRLLARVVANVQIQVRNVHVRLEVCDGIPHGGSPDSALPCLAVGVCVRSLVLTTTNEDGDDAFVDGTAAVCPVLLLGVSMLGGMNRVLRNGVHCSCHGPPQPLLGLSD